MSIASDNLSGFGSGYIDICALSICSYRLKKYKRTIWVFEDGSRIFLTDSKEIGVCQDTYEPLKLNGYMKELTMINGVCYHEKD